MAENQSQQVAGLDAVRPFHLEQAEVHGRLVRLGPALADILKRHAYPPLVEKHMAELATLACALASSLKFDGILTLQIRGDGPLSLMVADVQTAQRAGSEPSDPEPSDPEPSDPEPSNQGQGQKLNLRAYASYEENAIKALGQEASVPRLFGQGSLIFTLDQGQYSERYQGIVALEGSSLMECMRHYFAQSDQFAMSINLATRTHVDAPDEPVNAAALCLQRLPIHGGHIQKDEETLEDDWRRAVLLMGTATPAELLDEQVTSDALLYRLFHEEGVRVFEPASIADQCRCSGERVEAVLRSLSEDDLKFAAVGDHISTTCEFCCESYSFPLSQFLDGKPT